MHPADQSCEMLLNSSHAFLGASARSRSADLLFASSTRYLQPESEGASEGRTNILNPGAAAGCCEAHFTILYRDEHLVCIEKPSGEVGTLSSQPCIACHSPCLPCDTCLATEASSAAPPPLPGFHVHPPEDGFPIPRSENAMQLLKRQLGGTWLYPVHRLDRPTSGLVVYCTSR